jgi:signal transduction histidine kinase/CheY-like chemotaxis protein
MIPESKTDDRFATNAAAGAIAIVNSSRGVPTEAADSCSKPSKSQQPQSTYDRKKIKDSLLDGGLCGDQLRIIFPFHIVVNRHFVITHVGDKLSQFIPEIRPGFSMIDEIFTIKEPESCDWSWSKLCVRKHSSFVLDTVCAYDHTGEDDAEAARVRRLAGGLYFIGIGCPKEKVNEKGASASACASSNDNAGSCERSGNGGGYCDIGSMSKEGDDDLFSALFLVQPDVESFSEMIDCNITMSDFPKHSSQPKLIRLSESLQSEAYISEKSRAETASANRLLDMKRTFVRYVSHEVRTPLNTVSMGLKLIQSLDVASKKKSRRESRNGSTSSKESSKEASKLLAEVFVMAEEIRESCDIAVDILDDLLLYEKLEGNILTIDKAREAAVPLVFSTVKSFLIQARQAEVTLECSFDGDVFHEDELLNPTTFMDIDKAKVSQVLRNLISNAIKFIPTNNASSKASDRRVTVHLSVIHKLQDESTDCREGEGEGGNPVADLLQQGDDEAQKPTWSKFGRRPFFRVQVTDTGPGISVDNQKLLFKQIIQFDPAKLQGGRGSGLGLFISKGIMDLHGGSIGVHSEGEGKGSSFFLDFPISHTTSPTSVANGDGGSTRSAEFLSPQSPSKLQLQFPDSLRIMPRISDSASESSIGAASQRSEENSSGREGVEAFNTTEVLSVDFSAASAHVVKKFISSKPSVLLAEWKHHPVPNAQLRHLLKRQSSSAFPPSENISRQSSVSVIVNPHDDSPLAGIIARRDSGELSPLSIEAPVILPSVGGGDGGDGGDDDKHPHNRVSPRNPIKMRLSMPGETPGVSSPENVIIVNSILERNLSAKGSSTKSEPPTLKVLVVDDSVATRKMIMRFLKLNKLCANPLEASDGNEAAALIKANLSSASGDTDRSSGSSDKLGAPIDAILMDFIMPNMDGPTATKEIRDMGYKGLIVGLTGNVLPEDKAFFKAKGADEVLTKPADMVQLTSILRKHCVDRELASLYSTKRTGRVDETPATATHQSPSSPSHLRTDVPPLSLPPVAATESSPPARAIGSWTGPPGTSLAITAAAPTSGPSLRAGFSRSHWRTTRREAENDSDAEVADGYFSVTSDPPADRSHRDTALAAATSPRHAQSTRTLVAADGMRVNITAADAHAGESVNGAIEPTLGAGYQRINGDVDGPLKPTDIPETPPSKRLARSRSPRVVFSPYKEYRAGLLHDQSHGIGGGGNGTGNGSRFSGGGGGGDGDDSDDIENEEGKSDGYLRSAILTSEIEGGKYSAGLLMRNKSQKIPRNAVAPYQQGGDSSGGSGGNSVEGGYEVRSAPASSNKTPPWATNNRNRHVRNQSSSVFMNHFRHMSFKNVHSSEGCVSAPANMSAASAPMPMLNQLPPQGVGVPLPLGSSQSLGSDTSSLPLPQSQSHSQSQSLSQSQLRSYSPKFSLASFFSSVVGRSSVMMGSKSEGLHSHDIFHLHQQAAVGVGSSVFPQISSLPPQYTGGGTDASAAATAAAAAAAQCEGAGSSTGSGFGTDIGAGARTGTGASASTGTGAGSVSTMVPILGLGGGLGGGLEGEGSPQPIASGIRHIRLARIITPRSTPPESWG